LSSNVKHNNASKNSHLACALTFKYVKASSTGDGVNEPSNPGNSGVTFLDILVIRGGVRQGFLHGLQVSLQVTPHLRRRQIVCISQRNPLSSPTARDEPGLSRRPGTRTRDMTVCHRRETSPRSDQKGAGGGEGHARSRASPVRGQKGINSACVVGLVSSNTTVVRIPHCARGLIRTERRDDDVWCRPGSVRMLRLKSSES
jgi:hypothetical protein